MHWDLGGGGFFFIFKKTCFVSANYATLLSCIYRNNETAFCYLFRLTLYADHVFRREMSALRFTEH